MKTLLLITFSFLITSCTNRETIVDKYTLLGDDYRLFQETEIWELAKATEDNNFNKMIELVNEYTLDINTKEPRFGQTLLHLTIANGQFEACEQLLKIGANPNAHENYSDETPLIKAADIVESNSDGGTGQSMRFMTLLIKYGANVNEVQVDKSQLLDYPKSEPLYRTALIAACGAGFTFTDPLTKVKLLVSNGADIKFVGDTTTTALHTALIMDNYDVALYLLENGADYNQLFWEKNKYDENKPTDILTALRQDIFDFGTKEYEYKRKIIDFLKTKGLDYEKEPVDPRMLEEIKRLHPSNWEEYLKKY